MNAKTQYTLAYRNERMNRVNGAHIASDQNNLRFNAKKEFVKVETKYQLLAHESMCNNHEPRGNSRYGAMVREYTRNIGNAEQWLKLKKYFKLI